MQSTPMSAMSVLPAYAPTARIDPSAWSQQIPTTFPTTSHALMPPRAVPFALATAPHAPLAALFAPTVDIPDSDMAMFVPPGPTIPAHFLTTLSVPPQPPAAPHALSTTLPASLLFPFASATGFPASACGDSNASCFDASYPNASCSDASWPYTGLFSLSDPTSFYRSISNSSFNRKLIPSFGPEGLDRSYCCG